jgi:c-di-GMP-binding flagellar brake protein YcgR
MDHNTEYRRAKRKRAQETIDVVDTMTEQVVGRIGNISETGMMMLATTHLADDALFQFRFTLPDHGARGRSIEIGSHQLWSDAANVPGQFWAGFRFIDISPDDAALLRTWIDQPGGQYV